MDLCSVGGVGGKAVWAGGQVCLYWRGGGSKRQSNAGSTAMCVDVCCNCAICSDWKLEDVKAAVTRLHMRRLHADEVTGSGIVKGKVAKPFQDC